MHFELFFASLREAEEVSFALGNLSLPPFIGEQVSFDISHARQLQLELHMRMSGGICV